MSAAVWRPTRREAYPVLGVEGYRGEYADLVVELPATGPNLITVPVEDIRVSPDRSIVGALTATFTDHSRADRCQCERAQANPLSQVPAQSVPVATQSFGLTGGGEAGADPHFQMSED